MFYGKKKKKKSLQDLEDFEGQGRGGQTCDYFRRKFELLPSTFHHSIFLVKPNAPSQKKDFCYGIGYTNDLMLTWPDLISGKRNLVLYLGAVWKVQIIPKCCNFLSLLIDECGNGKISAKYCC